MEQDGSHGSDGSRRNPDGSTGGTAPTSLVVAAPVLPTAELKDFLKAHGYIVIGASSQSEALAKTRRYLPSFILLSCGVPGTNFRELLTEILMEHSRAAVILMAEEPRLWEAVEAIKSGAVDYLAWPLDFNRLKAALDEQRGLSFER